MKQLPKLEGSLPIPLSIVYVILSLVAGFIFLVYYRIIRSITTELKKVFQEIVTFNASIRKASYFNLSLIIIPFFLFTYNHTQDNKVHDMWDGEPLTDLLLPYSTITLTKEVILYQYRR